VIYICIPAHNEARTIGVLLWKIRNVMGEFGRDYEILVLDDASTDDTAATLDRYRSVLPVRVLRERERIGYPAALEKLLREAVKRTAYPKRDAVVTLQGDFTDHPDHIVTLVKAIEGGADIVAGRRADAGRAAPGRVRLARRLAPWVTGAGLREAPVADPFCGFRAYRLIVLRKALRALGDGPLLTHDGWAGNFELLARVAPHSRRIEEVPLETRYDIRTRPSRFRTVRTLRDLARVRGSTWTAPEHEAAR